MSLQSTQDIHWRCHYTSDGVSKTDLGETVLIYVRNTIGTLVINGLVCPHIGEGTYEYVQEDAPAGQYSAVFKTADTSVDQRDMSTRVFVGQGGIDYLDVSIAGVETKVDDLDSDLVAVDSLIDSIITTLSTLIANIWGYVTRKLTSAVTDEDSPVDMAATGGGLICQIGYSAIAGLDKIFLVRGDTKPYLPFSLTDSDGDPISIAGATIKFKMKVVGGTTLLINENCDPTDEANGEYEYRWADDDLDVDEGDYLGETEITFSDGKVQTWPPGAPFKIHIRDDLDIEE